MNKDHAELVQFLTKEIALGKRLSSKGHNSYTNRVKVTELRMTLLKEQNTFLSEWTDKMTELISAIKKDEFTKFYKENEFFIRSLNLYFRTVEETLAEIEGLSNRQSGKKETLPGQIELVEISEPARILAQGSPES